MIEGSPFIFMHLADAFIQSDLQSIQVIHVLSGCVFPGNWTHNLCAAKAMLYHWATGTLVSLTREKVNLSLFSCFSFLFRGHSLCSLAVNLWTQLRWKCRHSPHCIEALCTALCLHTNRWAFEGCIKVPHRPSWPTSRRTLCSSCLTAFVKRWFAPSLVRRKGLRSGKFCLYYEQYIYIYVFWLMFYPRQLILC